MSCFFNLILRYVIIRKRSNIPELLNALKYWIAKVAKDERQSGFPSSNRSVVYWDRRHKAILLPGFEVLQDIRGTTHNLEIGTPTALLSLSVCWQVKATSQT